MILFQKTRMFDCDETNMSLCPIDKQVFVERGTQAVYKVVQKDEKAGLKTRFTFNATGKCVTAMTFFLVLERYIYPKIFFNLVRIIMV